MDRQFNDTRNDAFICEIFRTRRVLVKQKNPMKNRKNDVPIDNRNNHLDNNRLNISHNCFQLEKPDYISKSD